MSENTSSTSKRDKKWSWWALIVIATFVAGYGLNYSFGSEANLSAWMRKNTPMSVFGISGIVIAFWLGFAISGLKALQHELRTARQKLASNDENATLLMASDPLLGELIDGTSAQNATRIRLVPEALTRLTRANPPLPHRRCGW